MKPFLFFIFLFSSNTFAKVFNHEIVEGQLHDYSFIDLCETMKAKNNLLISPIGLTELECFNQKFKISDFCLKKLPIDANFTRGFINQDEKKIYCETAKAVTISIDCKQKNICQQSKNACDKLHLIYANKLELNHSSVVAGRLNCYFTSSLEVDLDNL